MDPIDLESIRNFVVDRPEGVTTFGNAGHFDALPETHREQILFLDQTARKYLFSFTGPSANLFTGHEWDPFAKGNFKIVEQTFPSGTNNMSCNRSLQIENVRSPTRFTAAPSTNLSILSNVTG